MSPVCCESGVLKFLQHSVSIFCSQLLQFDALLCFLVSNHCEFKLFECWTIKDIWGHLTSKQSDWSVRKTLTPRCVMYYNVDKDSSVISFIRQSVRSAHIGAPRSASDRVVCSAGCIYWTRSMPLVSRPHTHVTRVEADVKVAALRGGAAQINLCEWLIFSWRPWQLPGSTPASRLCCKKPVDGWCGRDKLQRYKHF